MESLDNQLAKLKVLCDLKDDLQTYDAKPKAPNIPIKQKKIQPLVPQSHKVQSSCEPSYSSVLQNVGSNGADLYNAPRPNLVLHHHAGAVRKRSADMKLYGNTLPPGGTHHIYNNVPIYPGSKTSQYAVEVQHRNKPKLGVLTEAALQSHYSELNDKMREAVAGVVQPQLQRDASLYSGSQTSSTYESLYEPITPRPASALSATSNSTLYTPYVSGSQTHTQIKESSDYDYMTGLVKSTVPQSQNELFCGLCFKCGEKIVGETTGCTAMDHIYHIKCFCCSVCHINLQGLPFYSLNSKAYCETDYFNTLERCCVCIKPILDRILRATGKPYHPQCFSCVVCHKSLDGIPFTVDAMNRIHCIDDFHNKYAPRCAACKHPIIRQPDQHETVRVLALDRSFHFKCFVCEDCGVSLNSKLEGGGCYPLDEHILCKSCNAKRIRELTNAI